MSRAGLAMVVVAIMLGLAACGGDTDRALTVPGQAASVPPDDEGTGPPGAPSAANAQAALLTLDDLAAGWTVDPEQRNGGFGAGAGSSTPGGAESGECGRAARELADHEPLAEAETTFTAGNGTLITHSVNFFDQDAAPLVERLATVLSGCPDALSEPGMDSSSDVRIQPLSFPGLGDRTTAVRLVDTSNWTAVTVDFVLVAVGRAMSILFAGGADTLDGSELERLARLAVDRLS